jgi:AcrR family transcriptional regulator
VTRARDRVTQTATSFFLERGYSASSMRDLADALGVKAPSLYSHFPSKSELLRAVIAPALRDLDHLLDEALADNESPRRCLEHLAEYLIHHRSACVVCLWDPAVRTHPEMGPAVAARQSRMLELLAGFVGGDEVVAKATVGALVFPTLLSDLASDALPEIVAVAERCLGSPGGKPAGSSPEVARQGEGSLLVR